MTFVMEGIDLWHDLIAPLITTIVGGLIVLWIASQLR